MPKSKKAFRPKIKADKTVSRSLVGTSISNGRPIPRNVQVAVYIDWANSSDTHLRVADPVFDENGACELYLVKIPLIRELLLGSELGIGTFTAG